MTRRISQREEGDSMETDMETVTLHVVLKERQREKVFEGR